MKLTVCEVMLSKCTQFFIFMFRCVPFSFPLPLNTQKLLLPFSWIFCILGLGFIVFGFRKSVTKVLMQLLCSVSGFIQIGDAEIKLGIFVNLSLLIYPFNPSFHTCLYLSVHSKLVN